MIWELTISDLPAIEIGTRDISAVIITSKQMREEISPMYHARARYIYTDQAWIFPGPPHEETPLSRWLNHMKIGGKVIEHLTLCFEKLIQGCPSTWNQGEQEQNSSDWTHTTPEPCRFSWLRTFTGQYAARTMIRGVVASGVQIKTVAIEVPAFAVPPEEESAFELLEFRWSWVKELYLGLERGIPGATIRPYGGDVEHLGFAQMMRLYHTSIAS